MFDSIEAVLVRRVNISRAHRAGLVLRERHRVMCVCVCGGRVCVWQDTWLSVLFQWTLTAQCSNNNKDNKQREERKLLLTFCFSGFRVWQEWHFFYRLSFMWMLLLDVRVPALGLSRSSLSWLRALCAVEPGPVDSSTWMAQHFRWFHSWRELFFSPVYSRSNSCQCQQPDDDSATLKLHNYYIKSSIQ